MTDMLTARLHSQLEQLKFRSPLEQVTVLAEQAAKEEWSYLAFLDHLLTDELTARAERDITMKTKLAHFSFHKNLDTFDFAF